MTTPVINSGNITTEPSKGWAGFISMLATLFGLLATAYPKLPLVGHILTAIPVIGQVVPLLIAIGGMVYGAASSAVPQIRALFPWKKERVTVVATGGKL